MYEHMTFETILNRMLDRVLAQNPNLDTREGSIIYNALAPAAVELTNAYIQLDVILNESFADTQSRTYLIKRCAERGITPKPATKAVLQGEFNMDVPIGSRFSLDLLNYKVIEQISSGVFKLECETAGSVGNGNLGTLIPIDYIAGLTSAELTAVLIPGDDEEETEALRERYLESFQSKAFGGNIADYKEKTKAISGVGGVKVYPVWNGGGTVKLVIISSDFTVPSSTLVDDVQEAVDPVANSGQGLGIAPIGHVVTVEGVNGTSVNISTTITYATGWDWEALEPYVEAAIDEYFTELAKTWEDEAALIVRISQIEARILALTAVVDITGTTLNGSTANLVLPADNIPVRGVISG